MELVIVENLKGLATCKSFLQPKCICGINVFLSLFVETIVSNLFHSKIHGHCQCQQKPALNIIHEGETAPLYERVIIGLNIPFVGS